MFEHMKSLVSFHFSIISYSLYIAQSREGGVTKVLGISSFSSSKQLTVP